MNALCPQNARARRSIRNGRQILQSIIVKRQPVAPKATFPWHCFFVYLVSPSADCERLLSAGHGQDAPYLIDLRWIFRQRPPYDRVVAEPKYCINSQDI